MTEQVNQTETCTLRILHLPPLLSDERREELFKHFGAIKTRTLRKSDKYTITFVEFPNKETTEQAFLRLHQLPVKGRRLSIEFAKRNISVDDKENATEDTEASRKAAELSNNKIHFQAFLKKLNSWAPHHVFTQPIPPNIKYKYPAPTKTTLQRIAIQMVKEPAFYTQVLHLMNKMNLPPPFEELDDEFPIVKDAYDVENYKDLFEIRQEYVQHPTESVSVPVVENEEIQDEEELEEDESEIESDKEISNIPQIIPEKRKKPQSAKRLKIPKFVNPLKQPTAPSTSLKQRREDMFELHKTDPRSRKIVLKPVETANRTDSAKEMKKVITPAVESNVDIRIEPNENAEGFGLIYLNKKDEEKEDPEQKKQEFITTEELLDNKISVNDQRVLPVYKNYHPGKPSCRLYIKNLAKQVEESDLHFIYRRYVLPKASESDSEYNVRLMQEGRMKGQAFVTLPNVAQAQLALNETNGYILKDKPMVVQFAKVPNN